MDPELWRQRFAQDPYSLTLARHTLVRYHYEIPYLLASLTRQGLESLAGLTQAHLQQYWLEVYSARSRRGKPLTPATIQTRLGAAVGFVKFLVRNDYLLLDVSVNMKFPKQATTLPRAVLSESETLRLLNGPNPEEVLGLRDRAILELLYGSAIRNSELRCLQLGDIDWARHLLRIVQGKGRKDRWVPLGEEAEIWLEEYLRKSRPQLVRSNVSGETVFLAHRGRQLMISDLAALVSRWARKVSLDKHITPHCLRHSCATHMLRRGAGLRQLQVLLGHESLKTTQAYTRVELSDLRKTLSKYHPRERPR